ncbi:MAG: DUF2059 domain-containing protein [Rhodobacteraceae bacterium]|nr:DUF2059 domain-containing protein [Paracoccaceae bacterium]
MRILAVLFAIVLPLSALAQTARTSDLVLDALQLEQLLVILRDEAVDSGAELAGEDAGARVLEGWRQTLAGLNAPERVGPMMRDTFADALSEEDATAALAFFGSDIGQELVALEMSARQALNDPEVEAAVLSRFEAQASAQAPRIAALEKFIVTNDLIDSNVLGALNANAAFLQGMREGDPDGARDGLSDDEILSEVWLQEPEIRASTEDWVRAFLWLAYQPVSEDDLARYIAFSESGAGQALNTALFRAFDTLFVRTSYQTGKALSLMLAAQEI